MQLALTGREWAFLVVAIGPVILAIAVVWIFWRWAKRDEAREAREKETAPPADGRG